MNPIHEETYLQQNPLCDSTGFPNEIWLKVIQYLPTKDVFRNFALICKRFNNLTQDSSAVKYLEVNAIKTWPKYESVCKIISKSKSLIEFKIIKSGDFENKLITKLKSLVGLKIHKPNDFDNALICQALRFHPRLKILKIRIKQLDSEAFNTIALSKIEFLELDLDMKELPSDGITRLCSIKTLKSLTLSPEWLKEVKRDAYKNFQWNIIDVLNDNFNPKGRAPSNSPQKLENPLDFPRGRSPLNSPKKPELHISDHPRNGSRAPPNSP